MKCWFCNGEKELMWNSDFSFEDYGYEGEGIVTVLTCSNCNAHFEGYLDLSENSKNEEA